MTDDERTLVEAFVDELKADGRSPEDVAVPGLSPRTVRRYLDGDRPSRLGFDTKVAMARFLISRGKGGFLSAQELALADQRTSPNLPDGNVPSTYRSLFAHFEKVLGDASTPAREKAYLLDSVVAGMRIAGLIEEGAIAKARIRSLDGERDVAEQRQSMIDRADEGARARAEREPPPVQERPRFEIRDLLGPDADMIIAALQDLAAEARTKRGEKEQEGTGQEDRAAG
jgi:hypothetical protein